MNPSDVGMADESNQLKDEEERDGDDDGGGRGSDEDEGDGSESFSERWSFYECVVRGSVKGVESYLAQDPSLVNQPFRLSAIVDVRDPHHLACYCWQYFEVGFQIDHLAGFYPGTLSWHSRVYPQIDDDEGDGSAMEVGGSGGSPSSVAPVSSVTSSMGQVHSRISAFLLSLKKKEPSKAFTLRICKCRREDSLRLLLCSAASCRDADELDALVDDAKTMNKLAVTYPLHLAAMLGWRRVMETLLKHGADTSLQTRASGLQAIHLAVMYRRRSCLQTLIDAGAVVNSYAFHTDAQKLKGHFQFAWRILPISQAIELMLESHRRDSQRSPFEFKKKSVDELTDWYNLVQCNEDAEMIEAILQAPSGCDVNMMDGPPSENTYPLLRAIAADRALVERLLVAGADAKAVGWDRESSLTIALIEQDLELIKMLMFYGADPNHLSENNDTVLHFLAQSTMSLNDISYKMLQYFLDNGADPNVANNFGETPLMDSIMSEQIPVGTSVACDLLLSYPNVDVTLSRKEDLYQPIHSAAWHNLRGVVQTMLDRGADPRALTFDKNSPLGIAAFRRNREAVYCLAPLNRRVIDNADKDGDRAIHYAAYQGDVDMVNCLLDHGADPNVANDYQVTPIWYTCYYGHVGTLIQLLRFQTHLMNMKSRGTEQMENGYNSVNYIYSHPRSPLYAACDRGHFHAAQLLVNRGYPVHEEHSWILLDPPLKLMENDEFRRDLLSLSSSPPALRSRLISWFRTTFKRDLPRVVADVRLPLELKRELVNRDLPHVGKEYDVRFYDKMCLPTAAEAEAEGVGIEHVAS